MQAEGLHQLRHGLPVGLPGGLCRRVALEELPQHGDGHPACRGGENGSEGKNKWRKWWGGGVGDQCVTAGLVEEDGGHQQLPGVVEQRFLHQVVRRAGRRPLLEGLPPGWAEGYTQTHTRARTHHLFQQANFGAFQTNSSVLLLPVITVSGRLPVEVGARLPFALAALGL